MTIAISGNGELRRSTPLIGTQDPGTSIPEGYYMSWNWDSRNSEWTRQEDQDPEIYVIKKKHFYSMKSRERNDDSAITMFWIQNVFGNYHILQLRTKNHDDYKSDEYILGIIEFKDGSIIFLDGLPEICEKFLRETIPIEERHPFLYSLNSQFSSTGDNPVDWQILRSAVMNYHHELTPTLALRTPRKTGGVEG
jgi:hypothetical protein